MNNQLELDLIKASDKRRLFPRESYEDSLYYQYRDFISFWRILESDCFWATNARFSNDEEERQFGISIGRNLLGLEGIEEVNTQKDHFIVCFCFSGDKLSQWRGYAPYGGVAIGFDFSMLIPFTVFPRPKELGKGYADNKKDNVLCYSRPLTVRYYSSDLDREKIERDLGFGIVGLPIIDEENAQLEEQIKRYVTMIPYIKHVGFDEEDESRIVINSDDFLENELLRFENCICYRNTGNKKIPFIHLKPGNADSDRKRCSIRIRIRLNGITNWREEVASYIKNEIPRSIKYNIFDCEKNTIDKDGNRINNNDLNDNYCFGCSRRQWFSCDKPRRKIACRYSAKNFTLHYNERNSIIISQGSKQKEIFQAVYKWAMDKNREIPEKDNEIKVWCEGHLPIREIIVGPCENQNEMIETIMNFCLHSELYWLRCVDVKSSIIPYRTPIFNTAE